MDPHIASMIPHLKCRLVLSTALAQELVLGVDLSVEDLHLVTQHLGLVLHLGGALVSGLENRKMKDDKR